MLLHGIRTDVVPEIVAHSCRVFQIEMEILAVLRAIEVVEDPQAFFSTEFPATGTQLRKTGSNLGADPVKIVSGLLDAPLCDGYGQIPLLVAAVAAYTAGDEKIVDQLLQL